MKYFPARDISSLSALGRRTNAFACPRVHIFFCCLGLRASVSACLLAYMLSDCELVRPRSSFLVSLFACLVVCLLPRLLACLAAALPLCFLGMRACLLHCWFASACFRVSWPAFLHVCLLTCLPVYACASLLVCWFLIFLFVSLFGCLFVNVCLFVVAGGEGRACMFPCFPAGAVA